MRERFGKGRRQRIASSRRHAGIEIERQQFDNDDLDPPTWSDGYQPPSEQVTSKGATEAA